MTTVNQCYILDIESKSDMDMRSILVANGDTVPFNVERVYYLYGVPGNESRGAHAHKELYQLIVALNGSFDVVLDDGVNKKTFTLSNPNQGLLVVPGLWRDLNNFSSPDVVCLVLASMTYSEDDYIRNYEDFLDFKQNNL